MCCALPAGTNGCHASTRNVPVLVEFHDVLTEHWAIQVECPAQVTPLPPTYSFEAAQKYTTVH